MTRDDFATKVIELTDSLYYISYSMMKNRVDQEDAVQECIRKALQSLHALKNDQYFKTWIIRILINACKDMLRKRKREVLSDDVFMAAPESADTELFEIISNLEDKLRLPLILHYYEGYTVREISDILKVPPGTVKSRLIRARKELGTLLKKEEVLA